MDICSILMFVLSTVGMCHVIVDGSILQGFRNLVKSAAKAIRLDHLGVIVDCYLCAGTWCGFLMGWVWIVSGNAHEMVPKVLEVFGCGMAGGFMSNAAAVALNWVEANTLVHIPEESGSDG